MSVRACVRACACVRVRVRASRSNSLGGEPCVRAVTAIVAATVVYELQTLKVFRLASDDDLKTADIERLIRLVSGLAYSVTRSVRNLSACLRPLRFGSALVAECQTIEALS